MLCNSTTRYIDQFFHKKKSPGVGAQQVILVSDDLENSKISMSFLMWSSGDIITLRNGLFIKTFRAWLLTSHYNLD